MAKICSSAFLGAGIFSFLVSKNSWQSLVVLRLTSKNWFRVFLLIGKENSFLLIDDFTKYF